MHTQQTEMAYAKRMTVLDKVRTIAYQRASFQILECICFNFYGAIICLKTIQSGKILYILVNTLIFIQSIWMHHLMLYLPATSLLTAHMFIICLKIFSKEIWRFSVSCSWQGILVCQI